MTWNTIKILLVWWMSSVAIQFLWSHIFMANGAIHTAATVD